MRAYFAFLFFGLSACVHSETVIPVVIQYGNPIATAVIDEQEIRLIVDSGGFSLGLRPEAVARL